jgi:predicted outer membrane repeat protein
MIKMEIFTGFIFINNTAKIKGGAIDVKDFPIEINVRNVTE